MDRILLLAEAVEDSTVEGEGELRVVHRQNDACSQEEVEMVLAGEQP